MKKSRIILTLLPVLLIPSLVGIGFALYDFTATNKSSNSDSVNINVDDSTDVGSLKLVFKNLVGGYSFDANSNLSYTSVTYSSEYVDELDNDDNLENPIVTKLYFGFDEVNFRRSDNPSINRNFVLNFTKNENFDYTTNYKVSVDCLLTISDEDDRGVSINNHSTTLIPSTESILDVFKPTNISFKSSTTTNAFSISSTNNDDESEATSITYKANIIDDVSSLSYTDLVAISDAFYINFDYKTNTVESKDGTNKDYSFKPNDYPYSYTNKDENAHGSPALKVLDNINNAIENSSLSLNFVLSVSPRS